VGGVLGFVLGFVGFGVGVFCRRSGQCEGDGGVEEVERASLGVGGCARVSVAMKKSPLVAKWRSP
jgi:hypothetical protein